jgi:predicted DCC family thiol-disulfide oxidoreductase YuxK
MENIVKKEVSNRIVLFDGVCNLCDASVQFLIRHDPAGMFKFASLQSEQGEALMRKHALPSDMSTFVYLRDDKVYIKSAAWLRLLIVLKGAWRLAAPLLLIPGPVRNFVYDLVARNRYRVFGKKEACMIPTPALKARFL